MPPDEPATQRHDYGLFELIWSDYVRSVEYRTSVHGDESRLGTMLKGPVRIVLNAQLRAQALFRVTAASPGWAYWFWRNLLLMLHSCEVMRGATIGPRLSLPHPYGIGIGDAVVVGSGVSIGQHVTLGSNMDLTAQPRVGDDVVLLPGAVVAGAVTVGDGAVVGANSVLTEDLAPGGLCTPARTRVVNRRVRWGGPAGNDSA